MNREVCGICWCPYDEAGKCGCAPPCATQECMPSQCPNCASLEAQNTELDSKLAELEKDHADELTVAYTMGAQSRLRTLTDEVIAELWYKNGTHHHHFARAIERWLKGEK